MDIDDDDDLYAPDDAIAPVEARSSTAPAPSQATTSQQDEDLEEGEEEDEEEDDDSDSDIDIITERKDGTNAPPPTQAKYNNIRDIPQRTASSDAAPKPPVVKKERGTKDSPPRGGADLPAIATSKIDVDAKPIYDPAGKPITQINIDEDLPNNDKPWRRPGTDISDYFNYGFDEFTWALYAAKQESLRSEYDQDKIALNNKKMFDDMNMMMSMGGLPGMPGMPGGAAGGMPAIPGMEGMPQDMQSMMQAMMSGGLDQSQMDPAAMYAGMAGAQGAQGTQASNQSQGFGGQQSFGQGNQFGGYDQNMMGGGGDNNGNNNSNNSNNNNRNRGNFRGRGRGGNHRNW